MRDLLDFDRFPIDREGTRDWRDLVDRSAAALEADGMFSLEDVLRPGVAGRAAAEIEPIMKNRSFVHKRTHNIYFKPTIAELDADHPALRTLDTVGHTVCADQIPDSLVVRIYQYEPLIRFLSATMKKHALYTMSDPLARVNVMAYRAGEALNWHFDRSEFTTTLLLQAPQAGGDFEYRTNLRSDDDPNYDGVARLLEGRDPQARRLRLKPGTLNVFRGKNTAHRVTTVEGERERMVAVFSYFDRPGVRLTPEERTGFYGRAA